MVGSLLLNKKMALALLLWKYGSGLGYLEENSRRSSQTVSDILGEKDLGKEIQDTSWK